MFASGKEAELERYKYENLKLRTKNDKFKKHLGFLLRLVDQSTINEWNFSPSPQIPRRSHKSAKNHRHERTKLSSTRIQPSYAPADISSIHSLIEHTDNGTNSESVVSDTHKSFRYLLSQLLSILLNGLYLNGIFFNNS